MDSNLCKFSVLRYVPDENRQEFINIGVVLHSPEVNYIDCLITTNFSRVSAFDDEVDLNFLKIVLDGVKEDFSNASTVSGPSYKDLSDWNFLERATTLFVNQLQFSPIQMIRCSQLDEDILNLFKIYVYFDSTKKSRITEQEVKSIMNRVMRLKTNHAFQKIERNIRLDIGPEEIELDYAYRAYNKIKIVKTFSFDYTSRGSKHAPLLAKEWAYNFDKLKTKSNFEEKFQTNKNNIELLTLVYIGKENKNINIALRILKEESLTIEAHNQTEIESFADKMASEININ